MTHSQIRALLDDILHLSELIGGMNAQRTYKMYGPCEDDIDTTDHRATIDELIAGEKK